MRLSHFFGRLCLGVAAAAIAASAPARAADQITLGKAYPSAFPFSPADIGEQVGIFTQHDLGVTLIDFMGASKLEQGMASGDVDIGLGSGTGRAFIVKGAPVKAVATMAGAPLSYGIFVRANGRIKTIADLRGKRQAVGSPNSLVAWMLRHFSLLQGWGENDVQQVHVTGSTAATLAALKTDQVDATNVGTDVAYGLEKRGEGRLIVNYGDYIKTFITHAIFASDTMIEKHPEVLRRFLAAWFETIAYMNEHHEEAAQIVSVVDGVNDLEVSRESYQALLPMMLRDDMTPLYTEAFLPKTN